jgi:small subunit ribosomal protein S5
MHDALESRLPIREPEIVDVLMPSITDEVVDINMVQRMTDSGRRVKFAITCIVGNSDGFVGIGREKGKEVGPTIRRAIANAKLNIIEIKRGCGSWECGCGKAHSLPFAVVGKSGSVSVTFKPAPQGTSLAVGDVAKSMMRLAGIKDVWGFVTGHTKTTVNYALASYDALWKNATMKINPTQIERLHIVTGLVGIPATPSNAGAAIAVIPDEGADAAALDSVPPAAEGAPAPVEPPANVEVKGPEFVIKKLEKIKKEVD